MAERHAVAETACTKLHLDFPAIVDELDNRVGSDYAGWPDRIYVIQPDGNIGFKSGPGPWGFDPDELAAYLQKAVGPPDSAVAPPEAVAGTALAAARQSAPPIQGQAISGAPVSLAGLRGKTVLVDFWATWCPPCRAAMPDLVRLYRTYHSRGFEILGVNLDGESTGTTVEAARKFVKEMAVPGLQIADGKGWDTPAAVAYGVASLPTTVLVGPDGKILSVGLSGAALQKAVANAVASSPRHPTPGVRPAANRVRPSGTTHP